MRTDAAASSSGWPTSVPARPRRARSTSRSALGSGEGTGGFAIAANILGPDLNEIADYSKRALIAAQKIPSITDVKINLNLSNPEVHVAVDRKRAADLGIPDTESAVTAEMLEEA